MEFSGNRKLLAMRGSHCNVLFDSVRKNLSQKKTLFDPQKKYSLFFIKKTQFLENIYVEAQKKKNS